MNDGIVKVHGIACVLGILNEWIYVPTFENEAAIRKVGAAIAKYM